MPKRKLGKTGVEVSILGLGGMFDTINNQLLLKQAMKWGVTYWDTAEGYGNGLSEEGFGRFFSRNPEARKEIFLVTKLHAKGGNLTERLDKCLQRLQTNYVDLFFSPQPHRHRRNDPGLQGLGRGDEEGRQDSSSSASAPIPTWRTVCWARPDWTGSTR